MNMLNTPDEPNRTISRRTVSVAAAWTVPAVAVAVGAPAASASPIDPTATYGLTVSSPPFATTTCGVVAAGTVKFAATKNGAPAPAGGSVLITLPAGLTFVAGGQTVTVPVSAGGVVNVPAFKVTGSAGTYSISAVYAGVQAYATGSATVTAGGVYSFVRGSTATSLVPGITAAKAATSGWGNGNNFVINSSGTVNYWGSGVGGATAASPGVLSTSTGPLTGVTMVSSATMDGGSTTSGLAVAGNVAYAWKVTNAVPVAIPLTTSGTIQKIWAWNGANYILTDSGLYYNGTYFGTSATSAPAVATTGFTGSSQFSTWGFYINNTYFTGGGLVVGGVTYAWTAPGATLNSADLQLQASAPANIVKLKSNQSSTLALTANGELWTRGPSYNTSPGGTAWTRRATSVSDFDSWGNTNASGSVNYSGGAYQTFTGQVVHFGANSSSTGAYATQLMGGLSGVVATKIFAFDGVYYLLGSNGNAYSWIGNMDVPSRETSAGQLNVGGLTVTDIAPWGLAGWSGGGVLITPTGVCA